MSVPVLDGLAVVVAVVVVAVEVVEMLVGVRIVWGMTAGASCMSLTQPLSMDHSMRLWYFMGGECFAYARKIPMKTKAKTKTVGAELDGAQRRMLSECLAIRRRAEEIALQHGVDVGDVEHVLHNLQLEPAERLRRMFERASLRRFSIQ